MVIVVRSVFDEVNKCYLEVFLDECLYNIYMLEYDRIDISEVIHVNKTNGLRGCIVCY